MSENAQSEVVLVERDGDIMIVTINRPEARNAISQAVSARIAAAFAEAEEDADLRVVVITGAGDRAFSAGADLKEAAESHTGQDGWGLAGTRRILQKPVIAAVNGIAVGGGFEIALAADMIVASERAMFMLPEVKIGLFAGAGGALRLPAQLPEKIAMELLLTGEPLDASRAYALGLVNRVVPQDDVLATALDLARAVARTAPHAIRTTKRLARALEPSTNLSTRESWDVNDVLLDVHLDSAESREGRAAFVEKRPPQWGTVSPAPDEQRPTQA